MSTTHPTSSPSYACGGNKRSVFVIELPGAPAFAFAATSDAEAEELARSNWFSRAIDRFCAERLGATGANKRVRTATREEAAVFQDLADEFSEATDNFLVVHLTGGEPTEA